MLSAVHGRQYISNILLYFPKSRRALVPPITPRFIVTSLMLCLPGALRLPAENRETMPGKKRRCTVGDEDPVEPPEWSWDVRK